MHRLVVLKLKQLVPGVGLGLPISIIGCLVTEPAEKIQYVSVIRKFDRYQVDYIDNFGQLLAAGGAVSTQGRLQVRRKWSCWIITKKSWAPNFDLAIDFGWFYFLTKPFFYAINWLFELFGNFEWLCLLLPL